MTITRPKLKIGGHEYKVVLTAENGLSQGDCGKIDRYSDTIYINANMTKGQISVTLIHEILHAMNNELSEAMIDSLSEQIYAFLKDNKFIK